MAHPALRRTLALLLVAAAALAPSFAPAIAAPAPTAAPVLPDLTYSLGTADPFNYSDVVLLGNNNSQTSRNLTLHFQQVHSIADNNVMFADLPVGESISQAQWGAFAPWFEGEMANRSLGASINYIVTFKDIPIRVNWANANGPTSFQDALMLLGGTYESFIGNAGVNGYANPYFNRTERFSFAQFGLRLVTGIYAYNESTAMALIDRAAHSLGSRGEFVLDADASKGYAGGWGGYGYANQALVWANATLSADGWPTYLDTNNTYVTGRTGVMGYSSWGSNDCCWGSVTQVALPQNTWVNGSIGETFVSTGARTFTWPPSYGQSLIADWIDEGANGMKGYTDEPYISAIADGHILHGRYARGYNMAESFWAASHIVGWRQIVVGDPKMAPYADIGNLRVNATASAVPAALVQDATVNVTVAVENSAASAKQADIAIEIGGTELVRFSADLPAYRGSKFIVALDLGGLPPATWGAENVTVRVDPAGLVRESSEADNVLVIPVEIRRPPLADGVFDAASVLSGTPATLTLGAPRADRAITTFEVRADANPVPATVPATANAAAIQLSYPKSGTHQFWVTAVDSAGLRSEEFGPLLLLVQNRAPSASAVVNWSSPYSLESVHFDATASSDIDGSIVSYVWAGVGGAGGNASSFDYAFPRPGNFTVTLEVTDDEGASALANLTLHVLNRLPIAALLANASAPVSRTPVLFNGSTSSDLDGTIVSFRFEFDDLFVQDSSVPTVVHAFGSPGDQGLWLEVTDDQGATDRVRLVVAVQNRAPLLAWGTGQAAAGLEGAAFEFRAAASDLDGELASYTLSFGDGRRATRSVSGLSFTMAESHTYSTAGTFAVVLTFSDAEGTTTDATLSVVITHPAPQAGGSTVSVSGGLLRVNYTASSPYSGLELVIEVDGSVWRQVSAEPQGHFSADVTGFAPGNHTLHVYLTDGTASTDIETTTFHVEDEAAAPPPPPPPPPPPTPGVPLWGIFAAAAAAALVLRKRRATRGP